jgi:hypothetical protein
MVQAPMRTIIWLLAGACGSAATGNDAALDAPPPAVCVPQDSCYRQTTNDTCHAVVESCIFYPTEGRCTFAMCGDLPFDQCIAGDSCRWNSYEHRCYPRTLAPTCFTGTK